MANKFNIRGAITCLILCFLPFWIEAQNGINPNSIGWAPDSNQILTSRFEWNGSYFGQWLPIDSLVHYGIYIDGDSLCIEGGNCVYLASGTDDQILSIDSTGRVFTISIESGNSVMFEDQVNDADSDPTNELQDFFGVNEINERIRLGLDGPAFDIYPGNNIYISSPGDPTSEVYIHTSAADSTLTWNTIADTAAAIRGDFPTISDDQTLSIDSTGRVFDISIEDGNTITFEDQIGTDDQGFNYSTGLGYVQANLENTPDVIRLIGANGISITQGGDGFWTIDGSSINTDDQTLSIDSTGRVFNISIEDGNTITFEDQVDDEDWTISGSTLRNASNRDVGINIDPEHLLHIKSNNFGDRPFVIDQSNIDYPLFVIEEGGAGNGNLFLYNNDSLINTRLATSGDSYILNDSVGIGTDDPRAKLHVDGKVRINDLTTNNALPNLIVRDGNGELYTRELSSLNIPAAWELILRPDNGDAITLNDGYNDMDVTSEYGIWTENVGSDLILNLDTANVRGWVESIADNYTGTDDQDLSWNFSAIERPIIEIEDGTSLSFNNSDFIYFDELSGRLRINVDTSNLLPIVRDQDIHLISPVGYNPLSGVMTFNMSDNNDITFDVSSIGTADLTDDGTYLTPFDWINNDKYDVDQDGDIIQLKPTDAYITLGDTLRGDTIINGIGLDEFALFQEFKDIIGGNQGQLYSGGNGITIDQNEVILGVFDPDTMYDNATFDFGDVLNGTSGDTIHNVLRLQEIRDDNDGQRGASLVFTEKDNNVETIDFSDDYSLLITGQYSDSYSPVGKVWSQGILSLRSTIFPTGVSRIDLNGGLNRVNIASDSIIIGDLAKIEELKVKGAGSNYYKWPTTNPSLGDALMSDGTNQLVWDDPSSAFTSLWDYSGGFLGPESSVNSSMTNLYASNYSWNVDQTLGGAQDGYVMTFNNSTFELELQPLPSSSSLWEYDGDLIQPVLSDKIVNSDTVAGFTVKGFNGISMFDNGAGLKIGREAGLNYSSTSSLFIGINAGKNQTGAFPVMVGSSAGEDNTGGRPTFFGYQAGQSNTGDWVTSIGHGAGEDNTGDHNIFIGRLAGSGNTFQNVLIISNNEFGGAADTAYQDSLILFDNAYTVLDVNNYRFDIDQDLAGKDGYVLTYNESSDIFEAQVGGGGGSDTSLWESDGTTINPKSDETVNTASADGYEISGINAINLGSSQNGVEIGRNAGGTGNSVTIGRDANSGTAHTGDVVVGYAAASSAGGNNKTFFGQLAGGNSSGNNNVGIGYASLQLVSGANNTALGYSTGANADGNNNVYLGYQSGGNNNNDYNIFIGSANDVGGAYDYSCIIGSDDVTYDAEITASNQFKLGTMFDHAVLNEWELDIDQTLGAGQDNYIMTYDNSDGQLSLEDITTLITEGQWLDDGTGNIYRSSGKVTIGGGAADEDAKLTILSDGLSSDPLKIKSNVDDDLILRVQEGGAGHSNFFFYDKDENTTVQLTGSGSSASYLMCSEFGVGINSPTASLHVESAGSGEDAFIIENGNNANELFRIQQGGTGNANMFFNANDGTTNVQFTSSGSGNSFVNVGGFGINETSPATTLHVGDGDVYIAEPGGAIIMTAPDGGCWEKTVDNSGNWVTNSITCP